MSSGLFARGRPRLGGDGRYAFIPAVANSAPDMDMERRSRHGRTVRKRYRGDLEERLVRLEARVERLEREASVERSGGEGPIECSCCDDLIGCLDDCVTDVRELRKRVRDVRS